MKEIYRLFVMVESLLMILFQPIIDKDRKEEKVKSKNSIGRL